MALVEFQRSCAKCYEIVTEYEQEMELIDGEPDFNEIRKVFANKMPLPPGNQCPSCNSKIFELRWMVIDDLPF